MTTTHISTKIFDAYCYLRPPFPQCLTSTNNKFQPPPPPSLLLSLLHTHSLSLQVNALRWDCRNDAWDDNADPKQHGLAMVFPIGLQKQSIMADYTKLVILCNEIGMEGHMDEQVFSFHPNEIERRFRAPWPMLLILPNSSLQMDNSAYSSTNEFAISAEQAPLNVSVDQFDSFMEKCKSAAEETAFAADVSSGKAFIPTQVFSGRPKKTKGKRRAA